LDSSLSAVTRCDEHYQELQHSDRTEKKSTPTSLPPRREIIEAIVEWSCRTQEQSMSCDINVDNETKSLYFPSIFSVSLFACALEKLTLQKSRYAAGLIYNLKSFEKE